MDLEALYEFYPDEVFVIADGFDDAIMGVDEQSMRLIYSMEKSIEILCKDMPYSEAIEYFDFNVAGAYVGEKTPIWCNDLH